MTWYLAGSDDAGHLGAPRRRDVATARQRARRVGTHRRFGRIGHRRRRRALGVHAQNFQQTMVGRRAVLVSGLAALLIGAASCRSSTSSSAPARTFTEELCSPS